jgi:hypothetical protein
MYGFSSNVINKYDNLEGILHFFDHTHSDEQ